MFKKKGDVPADAGDEGSAQQPPEGTDAVALLDPASQLASVTAERDQLVTEKAELQDRLMRRMAEFENFRKRAEREKSELRDFATMETVRQLLPFLDDIERALKAETSDKDYVRGMELIVQRLSADLHKMGLEPIPTEGQKFDPHFHHALEMQPSPEAEEHAILAEFQKGYNFRGKLLRPALVRVAVAPAPDRQAEK
jgi:molecular chaperone GrpE